MGLSTDGKPITPWPGSWAATVNQPKHRPPMQLTPEQEDSIIQALRPLCPNQSPEQLRTIVHQAMQMIPQGADANEVEKELLRRFPALATLIKKP